MSRERPGEVRAGIEWGRKLRPRKTDRGHSPIRYGRGREDSSGSRRSYVLCECGVRLSGRGWGDYGEAAYRSFKRHQQRKARGDTR